MRLRKDEQSCRTFGETWLMACMKSEAFEVLLPLQLRVANKSTMCDNSSQIHTENNELNSKYIATSKMLAITKSKQEKLQGGVKTFRLTAHVTLTYSLYCQQTQILNVSCSEKERRLSFTRKSSFLNKQIFIFCNNVSILSNGNPVFVTSLFACRDVSSEN